MMPPEIVSTEPCDAQILDTSLEQVTNFPLFTLPPLNDDLREILGRPNFRCGQIAAVLRLGGLDIAQKAEAEQAAVIYWMLGKYCMHGADWWLACRNELQAILDADKPLNQEGGAA